MNPKTSTIKTSRLTLSSITDKDFDAVIEIFINEEVGKTFMVHIFKDEEHKVKLFERMKQLSILEDRFVYGIFLDNKLIGLINEVERKNLQVEVGYVIHPTYKNKGYATEALTASIEELFKIGYTCIKAGAFEENEASMRVMSKSGMVKTDEREQIEYRGKLHNCIYYEIHK